MEEKRSVASTVQDVTEEIVSVGVAGADPRRGSVEVAAEHLARHHDVGRAINKLIATHVRLAGTGFIAGVGGRMTPPVAIPANLTALFFPQGGMAGAIARLPITARDHRRLQTAAAPSFAMSQRKLRLKAPKRLLTSARVDGRFDISRRGRATLLTT